MSKYFDLADVSTRLAQALQADGVTIEDSDIQRLLIASADDMEVAFEQNRILAEVMFSIYASFDAKLAEHLGFPINAEDGFTLDWAGSLPNYVSVAMGIQEIVVACMCEASAAYKEMMGYGIAEVFLKCLNENVPPEIAAAQLEAQIQKPQFH